MDGPKDHLQQSLPASKLGQIDEVCKRFESAWEAGEQRSPEDFLREIPESDREPFLRRLVGLHAWLAHRAGGNAIHSAEGLPETADLDQPASDVADRDQRPAIHREKIGRYRVEKILGRGGFGEVYLARDDELDRLVAVKVAHNHQAAMPEDVERYLAEARVMACLDHPSIVPVFDAGRTEDGSYYIVSKYVEGTSLGKKIRHSSPSRLEAVKLVATIAEALHHAHLQGVVHRDVKPGNIIIDPTGEPHVADFGLALNQDDLGKGPGFAGTPEYMSPEQARGEGHRVDGRSDVFSLGIIFYELLVGWRPFQGDETQLLRQIGTLEPRPLRQIDHGIPRELERICLKALSKRLLDRYSNALDFAEDLRDYLASDAEMDAAMPASRGFSLDTEITPPISTGSLAAGSTAMPSAGLQLASVLHKGLRPFGAEDADFFLQLLPGPRDREGLPQSIRFWKNRIEETDSDKTFAVGLIFGPSGCGKSSFVNAGLLPRLTEEVIPLYVEATAEQTDGWLVRGLRKRCPYLPDDCRLLEAITTVRRGGGFAGRRKILIVLDQFERWLHANRDVENTTLVDALRHCDGGRVQCVVMVRDDFFLAVTRFFQALEIPLVEQRNSAVVDLFELRHARKVLTRFGQAHGVLPDATGDLTKQQTSFIEQAILGLSQDGRIVCVQLALFSEMFRGKPWTPAELKRVGGAEGVGVAFLEEAFSATTAQPQHRFHQKAARSVLSALLPEHAANLAGTVRSHGELLEASGYEGRPKVFEELMRILDSELRLVTPADGKLLDPEGHSPPEVVEEAKYYRVTHDYLVGPIREWLTRRQKETRRGRAQLRLAEQSALWNARPENRYLPSWWEWLNIRLLVKRKEWTEPQRKMLRKAGSYRLVRLLLLAVVLTLLTWGSFEGYCKLKADALVRALILAETNEVPSLVRALSGYRRWANTPLANIAERAGENSKERLNAGLALLPVDPGQVDYLYEQLLRAEPNGLLVLRDALWNHKAVLTERLWSVVEDRAQDEDGRFRAACALAWYAPDDPRWEEFGNQVAGQLVSVSPVFLRPWIDALRPVGDKLVPSLRKVFKDADRREMERSIAVDALVAYASEDPEVLADLICDADIGQFRAIFPKLQAHGERAVALLELELGKMVAPNWDDPPLDPTWESPDPALLRKIEAGHGLLERRFAFCQTMPLDDFIAAANELGKSGYRPSRFRPYLRGPEILVAAVWTRDGQPWQLAHGLTADQIRHRDSTLSQEGLRPVDVSGHLAIDARGTVEQYAAVWTIPALDDEAKIFVGLPIEEFRSLGDSLKETAYYRGTYSSVRANGSSRYSSVWRKSSTEPAQSHALFVGIEGDYSGDVYPGQLQVDVHIGRADKLPGTEQRLAEELARLRAELDSRPEDYRGRIRRAIVNRQLGNDRESLEELSTLIADLPDLTELYEHRAIVHARLGNAEEARQDLAKHQQLANEVSGNAYLDAVVSSLLGEDAHGMKRLEAAVAEHVDDADFLYNAACAYGVASGVFAEKAAAKARSFADRAVVLLGEAVLAGYSDYGEMQTDPDLDAVREHAGFVEIIQRGNLDRRYVAVWNRPSELVSTESHGLEPAEHLARARELTAQGYRPAAISVAWIGADGPLATASVWHRPRASNERKQRLAARRAGAAAGLIRMNRYDKARPVLKHSPDPQARSYLVDRLGHFGAHMGEIMGPLEEESDPSIRRALILSLGGLDEEKLPAQQVTSLTNKLLDWYGNDPDAGVHGAAEWLLRRWGREKDLHEIDADLSTGRPVGDRRWYVTGQGQTMVVVRGSAEFVMGSPANEPGRGPEERLHRRRIGRTFTIASREITAGQFRRFLQDNPPVERRHPRQWDLPANGPQAAVSWYEAAQYCNWLSDNEGIPEDQWCYLPNALGQFAEGMKLADNYLYRTGYRLPSKAEWEYACRAGAVTSRYYGQSEELLGSYAAYLANSKNGPWPVGTLKPNDLGLFDMLGNVREWCQDGGVPSGEETSAASNDSQEGMRIILNKVPRASLGGSFYDQAGSVRCAAWRSGFPDRRVCNHGFRVARTHH